MAIFFSSTVSAADTLVLGAPDTNRYGYRFEGQNDHREEAAFQFESTGTALSLEYTAYDIDVANEVQLLLNGVPLGFIVSTPDKETRSASIRIPLSGIANGINSLVFRQRVPNYHWGVTDLLLNLAEGSEDSDDPELLIDRTDVALYGFRFQYQNRHREQATFQFDPSATALRLSYTAYDIDTRDEVEIFVNGTSLGQLVSTPNNQLRTGSVGIPASLVGAGTNSLTFKQRVPNYHWGVTDLLLAFTDDPVEEIGIPTLIVDRLEVGRYGFRYLGENDHREQAEFRFESTGTALALDYTGFDIDVRDEVEIFVNGISLGQMAGTPNNQSIAASIDIPASIVAAGTNSLVFRQRVPNYHWGVTDLLLTVPSPADKFVDSDPERAGYDLIFNDEFGAGSLDPDKWATALLWGPYHRINNEQQLYIDTLGMHSGFTGYTPFEFTGDTLKITATPVDGSLQPPTRPAVPASRPPFPSTWRPYRWAEYRYGEEELDDNGNLKSPAYDPANVDFLSGIITSYGSLKMTHGYVEMRAKVPEGDGLWPAFWLLNAHYLEDSPEIDVMEFLGDEVDTLYNTYHYFDTSDGWRKISSPSFRNDNPDWTQAFHTFALAWSPEKLIWYVDGVKTHEVREGELVPDPNNRYPAGTRYRISGQAMYLLTNLAVGGNWPGPADKAMGPKSFEIDYIRAYKKKLPALSFNADGEFVPGNAFQQRFGDEFDGSTLNADKWDSRFIWGPYLIINGETQYYVDALGADANVGYSPFSVGNGTLKITARDVDDPAHGGWSPPVQKPDPEDPVYDTFDFNPNGEYSPRDHTSGILTSYDAFKFAHGYAEVRAKVPAGQGLWPAFWLLNGYYVAQQPEIDIMEIIGNRPDLAYHTYHRRANDGSWKPQEQGTSTYGSPELGYADGFHTFGVHWEHDTITWYVDGQQVHTYSDPDVGYQIMYVLLNLAVGGNFNQYEVPLPGRLPATFEIDHVRVYQQADPY